MTIYFHIYKHKGGSRHKDSNTMEIAFSLKRHASNYSTLHRSDLAARAAPLDPRLQTGKIICGISFFSVFNKIFIDLVLRILLHLVHSALQTLNVNSPIFYLISI